jgi:hypothetical protein
MGTSETNERIAERIALDEQNPMDGTSFWYGLHGSKEIAEKKVQKVNEVLAGTGAHAQIEFARNYNFQGKDWGSIIIGYDQVADEKLRKKYPRVFSPNEFDVLVEHTTPVKQAIASVRAGAVEQYPDKVVLGVKKSKRQKEKYLTAYTVTLRDR